MAGQVYDFNFEKMTRRLEEQTPLQPPARELTSSTGVTSQTEILEQFTEKASALLRAFEEAKEPTSESIGIFRINMLPSKEVIVPIDAILERDGEGFIARTIELPLYGYGSDPVDAIDMLKNEIESLYDDLMEDDDFTADWLRNKNYLRSRIND